jgi:CRISPR-associated protein Csx10
MPGFTYELTLLSDTVLTRVNATTDATTLPYVPGAALLGAAARRGYPADPVDAWTLFHSGRVRFGCGFPVAPEGMGVPMPKCLVTPKGAVEDVPLRNRVRADGAALADVQLSPASKAFLSPAGSGFEVKARASVRTAIDAETGAAKEHQLFALHAIPAGTRFVGRISADDPAHLARVRALLDGERLHLGRSRGAEMGEARLRVIGEGWLEAGAGSADRVVVLCLSDVVLRTPDGAPTFTPSAEHLGLPEGWAYRPEHSVVRVRAWSPWNSHRSRPDLERQAIEAGSVLVFAPRDGAAPLDRRPLAAALDRGIGEHRQDGLGQVWLEPAPLSERTVAPWKSVSAPPQAPAAPGRAPSPRPRGPLVGWLEIRARESATTDRLFATASREATHAAYARIRAAQWGELRALAAANRDAEVLRGKVRAAVQTDEAADAARRAAPAAAAPKAGGRVRKLAWYGEPGQRLEKYLVDAGEDASLALELLASQAPRARQSPAREDAR